MSKIVTVLVGPPCSGKSTYLKTLDYDFVISSDDIVEVLCRQHSLQYHQYFKLPSDHFLIEQHNKIFNELVVKSHEYDHVVWDLTNLTRKSRAKIFAHYPSALFRAVVFRDISQGQSKQDKHSFERLLLERNQARFRRNGKFVDEAILKKMVKKFEMVDKSEGFTEINVIG